MAIARPIPRLAPVTTARCPSRSPTASTYRSADRSRRRSDIDSGSSRPHICRFGLAEDDAGSWLVAEEGVSLGSPKGETRTIWGRASRLSPNALGALYMALGSLATVVHHGLVRVAIEDGLDVYQGYP